MRRRQFLALGAGSIIAFSGCSSGGNSGSDSTLRRPNQVTTSADPDIEILVAQIAIAPDATGPDAYYRLRNIGETDTTIKIVTRLTIEDGGTYSSFAMVTVPTGDEVTVRYRIVRFDDLSEAERSKVRHGDDVTFEVFINGQKRDDV